MARWQVHQTDGNAPELERAAKKLGLTILKVGRPVDWVVCAFGLAVLCEVKTDKGKLRPDQIRALRAAGVSGWVLRDTSDVIAVYRELRFMADALARVGWPNEQLAAKVQNRK